MLYNVLDVCRYIVKYSDENNKWVSNLKLQKLLYFIQAMFLVNKDEPCFGEIIEAWEFGPVVPVAYYHFKRYGGLSIPEIEGTYCIDDGDEVDKLIRFDDTVIKEDDKKMIRHIVKKLAPYSASFLVDVTHRQDPWKNVYVPYMNNEITKESIREFFKP